MTLYFRSIIIFIPFFPLSYSQTYFWCLNWVYTKLPEVLAPTGTARHTLYSSHPASSTHNFNKTRLSPFQMLFHNSCFLSKSQIYYGIGLRLFLICVATKSSADVWWNPTGDGRLLVVARVGCCRSRCSISRIYVRWLTEPTQSFNPLGHTCLGVSPTITFVYTGSMTKIGPLRLSKLSTTSNPILSFLSLTLLISLYLTTIGSKPLAVFAHW